MLKKYQIKDNQWKEFLINMRKADKNIYSTKKKINLQKKDKRRKKSIVQLFFILLLGSKKSLCPLKYNYIKLKPYWTSFVIKYSLAFTRITRKLNENILML